jgi:hypothetical protein
VHRKFKDWPLKQPLIAPNSQENPGLAQPAGCVCPGGGGQGNNIFSLFLFLSISTRCSINQNQTLWHTGLLTHGKPSYTPQHWTQSQEVSILRKMAHISPHGWFQSCLCKPADPTGEQHTPHTTPLPTPGEHNPAQPLGRLNHPSPNKTEKHKQQIVI